MAELTYTIYDVAGFTSTEFRMLVHTAEEPDNALTFRSAIVRRDARGLALERVFDEWVTSMWQSPTGLLCAVSMAGNIHTREDNRWATMNVGKRVYLNNVWGLDDDRIYCCGLERAFLKKAAASWDFANDGLQGDLTRVGGSDADNLYVLGERGAIYHFDGSRWSAMDSPTNRKLLYLSCPSREVTYVCGRNGTLFRRSGDVWEQLNAGGVNLYSLAHFRDKMFFGAGVEGIFELRDDEAVVFRSDLVAYGLQVIGDSLFVFGNTHVEQYDGRLWSGEDFNFEPVVSP
jgi:hypothetical protein